MRPHKCHTSVITSVNKIFAIIQSLAILAVFTTKIHKRILLLIILFMFKLYPLFWVDIHYLCSLKYVVGWLLTDVIITRFVPAVYCVCSVNCLVNNNKTVERIHASCLHLNKILRESVWKSVWFYGTLIFVFESKSLLHSLFEKRCHRVSII